MLPPNRHGFCQTLNRNQRFFEHRNTSFAQLGGFYPTAYIHAVFVKVAVDGRFGGRVVNFLCQTPVFKRYIFQGVPLLRILTRIKFFLKSPQVPTFVLSRSPTAGNKRLPTTVRNDLERISIG